MTTPDALDTMARTVWAEARGEHDPGMLAVAWVIKHRADHPRWWGHDVANVCTTPWQFSCWNKTDPNLPKLLAVDRTDPYFAKAVTICEGVLACTSPDPTLGATSYFDRRMPSPPPWAVGRTPCATIGHHVFFKDA